MLGEQFRRYRNEASLQLQVMREFLTPPLLGSYRAIGFKIKLQDVGDPKGFAELLKEKRVYIIHLSRRNLVKQVVSYFKGLQLYHNTGDWNLYKDEERLAGLTIDPAEFRPWLEGEEERRRAVREYVMLLELPTLSLYYEDLLVDKRNTIDLALSFLGVQLRPVEGEALKNTSDDLRQALENFDELRSLYTGTPYETMFDEVILPAQIQT
jgi:hypothetical protein